MQIYTMKSFLEDAKMIQGCEFGSTQYWVHQYNLYASKGIQAGPELHDITLMLCSPYNAFQVSFDEELLDDLVNYLEDNTLTTEFPKEIPSTTGTLDFIEGGQDGLF